MLTMVNPAISYHIPDGHIVGVRVKRLFEMLDAVQIEPIIESLLRSIIRSRKGCKVEATQYFPIQVPKNLECAVCTTKESKVTSLVIEGHISSWM